MSSFWIGMSQRQRQLKSGPIVVARARARLEIRRESPENRPLLAQAVDQCVKSRHGRRVSPSLAVSPSFHLAETGLYE
jgi:hypothetical protein